MKVEGHTPRRWERQSELRRFVLIVAFGVLLSTACSGAENEDLRAAGGQPALLWRLIARLPGEPLLALYTEDLRALPAKFSRTSLNAMLQDPSYAENAGKLQALIKQAAGADIAVLWPEFSKMVQGPAVLAIETPENAGPMEPALKLVLLVATPTEETAGQLLALWPKPPPQSNTLFSVLRLQPIAMTRLTEEAKARPWLAARTWLRGDLCVRARPAKAVEALGPWLETVDELGMGWGLLSQLLSGVYGQATGHLGLRLAINGELFNEEAELEITLPASGWGAAPARAPLALPSAPKGEGKDAPAQPSLPGEEGREEAATLLRVAHTLREQALGWEALLGALPGGNDLVLLSRLEPKALGPDLPFAAQAVERYLRGKRWGRGRGRTAEALEARRFEFLLKRLEGSLGIVAKPALSGDMRVTVATGLSTTADEMEAFRGELLEGLANAGAEFEALGLAGKNGGLTTLGARFQGRGMFGAPVLGLSPGWAWLCSNSAAYQELSGAFRLGRTLAAEHSKEQTTLKASGKDDYWRADDAARLQVELERVVKLAYAAWILSGESTLRAGGWKVPAELLPQPQVFNNRTGVLRTGMSRQGNTLKAHASSVFPGASLILPYLVYEAADTIEEARRFSREAAAMEQEQAP